MALEVLTSSEVSEGELLGPGGCDTTASMELLYMRRPGVTNAEYEAQSFSFPGDTVKGRRKTEKGSIYDQQ